MELPRLVKDRHPEGHGATRYPPAWSIEALFGLQFSPYAFAVEDSGILLADFIEVEAIVRAETSSRSLRYVDSSS